MRLLNNLKREWHEYKNFSYMSDEATSLREFAWLVLRDAYLCVGPRLWCRLRGHELVDEGWAGPESGAIVMVCRRCQQEWSEVLY